MLRGAVFFSGEAIITLCQDLRAQHFLTRFLAQDKNHFGAICADFSDKFKSKICFYEGGKGFILVARPHGETIREKDGKQRSCHAGRRESRAFFAAVTVSVQP
jgi:hypothetical protein